MQILQENISVASGECARLFKVRRKYTQSGPAAFGVGQNRKSEMETVSLTLRKASFCSRCLLIIGVTWSDSLFGPSLSAPPHQSSSRLYSCSRLSNTLHTWDTQQIFVSYTSYNVGTAGLLFGTVLVIFTLFFLKVCLTLLMWSVVSSAVGLWIVSREMAPPTVCLKPLTVGLVLAHFLCFYLGSWS